MKVSSETGEQLKQMPPLNTERGRVGEDGAWERAEVSSESVLTVTVTLHVKTLKERQRYRLLCNE